MVSRHLGVDSMKGSIAFSSDAVFFFFFFFFLVGKEPCGEERRCANVYKSGNPGNGYVSN